MQHRILPNGRASVGSRDPRVEQYHGLTAVSVESLVQPSSVHKNGFYDAYVEELFKFLGQTRAAILQNGPGDYRQLYPNYRSWIEYYILLYDLSVNTSYVSIHTF